MSPISPSSSTPLSTASPLLTEVRKKFYASNGEEFAVSPSVLSSMVSAAMASNDTETLQLLISESSRVGYLTSEMLEESIAECILASDSAGSESENLSHLYNAAHLLEAIIDAQQRHARTYVLSEGLCQRLMTEFVANCRWRHSALAASYMIQQGYSFSDREMFATAGGLLGGDSRGVDTLLELMILIAKNKRDDVAMHFNWNKVHRYSQSMRQKMSTRVSVDEATLGKAMDAIEESLKQDWFSFSLSKMMVAIACAAGHNDLASKFVKNVVDIVAARQQQHQQLQAQRKLWQPQHYPLSSNRLDLLSVLRGFSQGAGIVSKTKYSSQDGLKVVSSPVSKVILSLTVKHMELAGLREGPLHCMDLFKMYWVLAHRLRHMSGGAMEANSNRRADNLTPPSLPRIDNSYKWAYDELVNLANNPFANEATFTPQPGNPRRIFRTLCDELGFRHRILDDHGDSTDKISIRVWKVNDALPSPPSLESILARDNSRQLSFRKFDGLPYQWEIVSSHLTSLSPRLFSTVCKHLLRGMSSFYASSDWGLEVLRLFREENVEVPNGFLVSLLQMADARSDIYGATEVLYYAYQVAKKEEKLALANGGVNGGNGAKSGGDMGVGLDGAGANVGGSLSRVNKDGERRDGMGGKLGGDVAASDMISERQRLQQLKMNIAIGGLSQQHWNLACSIAWKCKKSDLSPKSFTDAFTEIMRLLRECKVELSDSSIRNLLRFLVKTQSNSEATNKILRRLYRDKTMEICHVECAAISHLLLRRLHRYERQSVDDDSTPEDSTVKFLRTINLATPHFKVPNYLNIYPEQLTRIVNYVQLHSDEYGQEFVTAFQLAWSDINKPQGRAALYDLMLHCVSVKGRRSEFVNEWSFDALMGLSSVCVYAAYAVAVNDKGMRAAYDLLYAFETAIQEHLQRAALDKEQRVAELQRRLNKHQLPDVESDGMEESEENDSDDDDDDDEDDDNNDDANDEGVDKGERDERDDGRRRKSRKSNKI